MNKFSLYLPIRDIKPFSLNNPTKNIEPTEFYEIVRSGLFNQLQEVKDLRELVKTPELKEQNKAEYTARKEHLAGSRASGCFAGGRDDDNMVSYSYRVVLDLDNLYGYLPRVREICQACDFVEAVFTSVGNQGLAVVIPVDLDGKEPSKELHRELFFALEKYFRDLLDPVWGPEVIEDDKWCDASCKNVSRFRYISYDPDLYYNPMCGTWSETRTESLRPKKKRKKLTPASTNDEPAEVQTKFELPAHQTQQPHQVGEKSHAERAIEICTKMILEAADGDLHASRRDASFLLGGYMDSCGIDAMTAYDELMKAVHQRGTKDPKKAEDTIRSGINKGRSKPVPPPGTIIPTAPPQQSMASGEWWSMRFNDKGQHVGFTYSMAKYTDWLSRNYNIYRHTTPHGDRQVIQCKHGICTILNKDLLHDILKPYFDSEMDELHSDIVLSSTRKREFLDPLSGLVGLQEVEATGRTWDFQMMDAEYMFFKNCIVEVSKAGKKAIKYKNFKGLIWDSQVIDRDFKLDDEIGVFERFVNNISDKSINSFKSVLGYMLHSMKIPSLAYMPVVHDQNDSDQANGGTGKSLFCSVLQYYRSYAFSNGKNVSSADNFLFENVTEATQVLHIDDLPRGFRSELLWNFITGHWESRKKRLNLTVIPFKDSPKLIGTTNYVLKKSGDSDERRIWPLEVNNYYGPHLKVQKDFGHNFFTQWVDELAVEWTRCDNFMANCLAFYFEHGLVAQEFVALKHKEFLTEVGQELVDFLDENSVSGVMIINVDYPKETFDNHNKKRLRKAFIMWLYDNNYDDKYYKGTSLPSFWNRVERWAKFREFEIKERRSGSVITYTIRNEKIVADYLASKIAASAVTLQPKEQQGNLNLPQ